MHCVINKKGPRTDLQRLCLQLVAIVLVWTVPGLAMGADPCVERRAAIDMGSGMTKLKVKDVRLAIKGCDTETETIEVGSFSITLLPVVTEVQLPEGAKDEIAVNYAEALALSTNNPKSFSPKILIKGWQALQTLKAMAKTLGAVSLTAVATAAFRKLRDEGDNAQSEKILELINRPEEEAITAADLKELGFNSKDTETFTAAKATIKSGLGITAEIIDQETEALFGFTLAVARKKRQLERLGKGFDPTNYVVWDIGNFGIQIVGSDKGQELGFFLRDSGSQVFKQQIIGHQIDTGTRSDDRGTPNPMSAADIKWAAEQAVEIGEDIADSGIDFTNKRVIGIGGVHFWSLRLQIGKNYPQVKEDKYYLPEWLAKTLKNKTNWQDNPSNEHSPTQVANLALVNGILEGLNAALVRRKPPIDPVEQIEVMNVNMADALLANNDLSAWGANNN